MQSHSESGESTANPFFHDPPAPDKIRLFQLKLDSAGQEITGRLVTCTHHSQHLPKPGNIPQLHANPTTGYYLFKWEKYDALSWCWGTSEGDDTILMEGLLPQRRAKQRQVYHTGNMKIPSHLHRLLLNLRAQGYYRYIWIDAICINQQSAEDRAFSIPLMGAIYGNAHRVLIWLGENEPLGQAALQRLPKFKDRFDYCHKHKIDLRAIPSWSSMNLPARDDEIWHALRKILRHPWWSRLWTLQEVVLPLVSRGFWPGDSVLFLCGDFEVPWSVFCGFAASVKKCSMQEWLISEDAWSLQHNKHAFDCAREVAIIRQNFGIRLLQRTATRLGVLMYGTRRRQATLPVDTVIGQSAFLDRHTIEELGLIPANNAINVFVSFAKFYLRHEMFECLFNHVVTETQMPELPSWCPNFASTAETLSIGSLFSTDLGFEALPFQNSFKTVLFSAGFELGRPNTYTIPIRRLGEFRAAINQMRGRHDYYKFFRSDNRRRTKSMDGTDEIEMCGVDLDEVTETVDCNLSADSTNFLSAESSSSTLEWDRRCWDVFLRARSRLSNEPLHEGSYRAYAIAITAGLPYINSVKASSQPILYPRHGNIRLQDYGEFKQFLQALLTADGESSNSALHPTLGAERFGRLLGTVTRRRKFFATQKGHFGLGPSKMAIGDNVRVVFFCPTPYLFRPCESGKLQLVGEVFVYNFMYGEILTMLRRKQVQESKWIVV